MINAFRRLFSNSQNRKARRVFGLPRPELLSLEQRINPATFTYDSVSEALTIDLNNMNEVLTLTSSGTGNYVFTSTSNFTGTNTTGLTGNGTRTLTITSALVLNDVAITDSVAGTDVKFGANSGAYVDNFSITLNAVGESVVTVANATAFTGAAGLNVAAARNIVISANLSTATGNIVLDADNGVQQTGNFKGVDIDGVSGAEVTTTGGNITIEGRGGDTGGNQIGVWVFGAKVQAGGTGTVSVTGTGGAASGGRSDGVLVESPGSIITSSGGSVTVIGTGGGTGASTGNDNYGLKVDNFGNISAGGTGTVSVTGTGGAGTSPGIILTVANITTNSSGAAITLTADSMAFDTTSVVSSTGTVTLQNKTAGVAINLGTETAGQLSLTDAELDRVTAGMLVIGRSDINPGVITVSNALTLPSTVSALQLIGPAGITLNNNVTTTGSQTYTGAVTLGANSTLNAGNGNILLPGTVSNSGAGTFSLTPITSGAGLTTISGANTNTTTNVTTGIVKINNSTASTTNFAVSGGTLKGTGSIGNLTGTGTGIIAPGNSPGLVTTTNLSLSSGNTLQIEINNVSPPVAGTDYDQIVVSSGGTVALGSATLSLSTTFTGSVGTVFTIIDNQGSSSISTTFNGLAEGAIITANGKDYQISYVGGTGNDITLTVVAPTPTPTPTPSPTPTPTPTPSPTAPLITGTPPPPSTNGSSTVNLYNPATGQPTGSVVPFPGFEGPVKVASGDFNNDGIAELVAGAGFGGGPAIAILDSQTGAVMESFFAFDPAFTGGVFVAVQDTNGDGILDIIASAGPGGGPEVRIFNGANLNLIRSFYAYAEDFTGGVSVASIDFNNDGILDLVTGAGPGGAPHVKVYDGATNAIISQWYAYPVTFTGGVFVAVGDIGNDGTFEVVTGAGQGGAPVVAVWDPFTGALLSQFYAYAEDFTGGARVAINDGNGDGIADILTGAGPSGGPHVKAFSFPALDILFQFYSGESTDPGGVFVG